MISNGTFEITTSIGCAVNCKYCPQPLLISRYKSKSSIQVMSLDTFKRCVDKIPKAVHIHFSGFSEPWQNPNCTEMVLYAHHSGHIIQVFSTLQGMSIDEFDAIKSIPFEKFIIHLPDSDGNSKIKNSDAYRDVLQHVTNHLNSQQGEIKFGFSIHGSIDDKVERVLPPGLFSHQDCLGVFTELHDRAGTLNVEQMLHRTFPGHIMCTLSGRNLNRNVLLPDGSVYLCCMDYGLDNYLGNLLTESYSSLFTSQKYEQLIEGMDNVETEIICRHCINATEYSLPVQEKAVSIPPITNIGISYPEGQIDLSARKNVINGFKEWLKVVYWYIYINNGHVFDSTYYLTNNLDVREANIDPLLHYLLHGWKEGRNPCLGFNTNFYLAKYSDVNESGINPLFHFMRYGRRENRISTGSPDDYRNTQPNRTTPLMIDGVRTAVVVLIRNEQDIVATFLNHIDALFDIVYLVNHRSIDATKDILVDAVSKRKRWKYISAEMNGYYQKEISNYLLPNLFNSGADYVFFLDADEFIQVGTKAELHELLEKIPKENVIGNMPWVNCIIDDMQSHHFSYHTRLWKSNRIAPFSKVIIPRSYYQNHVGNITISQGNHFVYSAEGMDVPSQLTCHLLHVPIRSAEQMVYKAIRSSLTNYIRGTKKPGESYQFRKMLESIRDDELDNDHIRGIVSLYENKIEVSPIAVSDLPQGYVLTSLAELGVASSGFLEEVKVEYPKNFLQRVVAEQLLSSNEEPYTRFEYDHDQGRFFIP